MELNQLAKLIHEINVSKGFWDKERNPLAVLALIHSEVSEAVEDIRDGRPLNEIHHEFPIKKPIGVPSEMADIIIRVLDACAAWDIDIEAAIKEKMEYNKTRGRMHGKLC